MGDGAAMQLGQRRRVARRPARRRRQARDRSTGSKQVGCGEPTVNYKLRDWLFSRQRYWGEPFPIVYDEHGADRAARVDAAGRAARDHDFEPATSDDPDALPEPPLARAPTGSRSSWTSGAWAGRRRRSTARYCARRTRCRNGRARAGTTCATSTPTNEDASSIPRSSAYWAGPATATARRGRLVDLYVGGVEHAVLHLLYARFWHKVLFDLGHVSTVEPFQRLVNQGMIQAAPTPTPRRYVEATEVVERDGAFLFDGEPVTREFGKMGKSLKNVGHARRHLRRVRRRHVAAVRDVRRARWTRRGRGTPPTSWACYRFLQRLWRNVVDEETGAVRVPTTTPTTRPAACCTARSRRCATTWRRLRFNTAIARLIECNNHLTPGGRRATVPRRVRSSSRSC